MYEHYSNDSVDNDDNLPNCNPGSLYESPKEGGKRLPPIKHHLISGIICIVLAIILTAIMLYLNFKG